MYKKLLISALVLVALVTVVSTYFVVVRNQSNNESSDNKSNLVSKDSQNTTNESSSSSASSEGEYSNYTEAKFESSTGTRLLFFHAPWCPQCRELDADIKSTNLPEDITILKVDYDSNQDLRSKYGVTIQTTVVKVDDTGKLVEKYVAYEDPTFASVEENLLK